MISIRGYVPQGRSRLTRSRFSEEAQKAADEMKKLNEYQGPFPVERKWLLSLLATAVISMLLLLANLTLGCLGHHPFIPSQPLIDSAKAGVQGPAHGSVRGRPPPPKLAYMISGSKGDGIWMQRALYHPHYHYLLHLDLEAPRWERAELARYVEREPVIEEVGNVFVVGKANMVTYKGPSMIAATLHGAAILLRKAKDWDGSSILARLITPSLLKMNADLLHVFSYLPKYLNFLEQRVTWAGNSFSGSSPSSSTLDCIRRRPASTRPH